jgi:hypothetical protein
VPITVEDGTGLPDANAYCDLAFADAYHADRGNAAWTGDDAAKSAALIKATDYLRRYSERWLGYKTKPDQALDWPRVGVMLPIDPRFVGAVETDRGVIIASPFVGIATAELANDFVPDEVKMATAELALRAMAAPLAPDQARGGKVKQKTIGPITTIYFDSAPAGTTYPAIDSLVEKYLRSAASPTLLRG